MPNKVNTINRQSCSATHTSKKQNGAVCKKKRRAEKKQKAAKSAEHSSVVTKVTEGKALLGDASLRVLLMSENFALAASLAMNWEAADKLVATAPANEFGNASVEAEDDDAEVIQAFGGCVLHGVNTTALHVSMEVRQQAHTLGGAFERIVFDCLPKCSAGSASECQALLSGCFKSVLKSRLLAKAAQSRTAGQLHVILTAAAAAEWGVVTLAAAAGLRVHSPARPLELQGYEPPCGTADAVVYAFVEL